MQLNRYILAACLICAAACTGDASTPGDASYVADTADASAVDSARDIADVPTDSPSDAGSDSADSAEDSTDTVQETRCERVTVEMSDGEVFEAQLIETYDHRVWWWDVADRTTLAFFQPAEYAAFPDDASFRFEALADVVSMQDAAVDGDDECYLDFIDRRAFTVDALPLDETSQILMGNEGYHRYEGGYGDFAWDFTRTDPTGARYMGDGTANSDYVVWQEPVFAPVSGYVVDVVDDAPDHPPGDYPEGATNNLVGIHLGGSFYIYLLHLEQSSVPDDIQPDTLVDVGDKLGVVGNSGVSLEPHLHLTMLWYDAEADRSWSIPTRFQDVDVAPTPKGPWRDRQFYL
ncbi:MAG: M23 family metallopeptidase, partial [Myxococcota bacterium]